MPRFKKRAAQYRLSVRPMSKTRIVFHVFHSTGIGGAEIHLLQLAMAQRELGWTPKIVARPDSWLAEQGAVEGIEILPLRMRGYFDLVSMSRLIALVRRHRPDVLHGHAMRGSHYARAARRWNRSTALVMTAHSTNSWRHFDRRTPIICVSRAVERALRGRGFSKLHLIYNGIPKTPPTTRATDDLPMYREIAARKHGENRLLILHVGRFIRDKAQDWLLDQWENLPAELADTLLIVFVGDWQETDYGRSCHRRLSSSALLRDKAVFVGPQSMSALTAWYDLADLLVLPSRREAFGLTLLEGARAGLPALASEIGGIPEAVLDNRTGFLFPPEDGSAFLVKLRMLLDEERRKTLGAAAKKRFLGQFTTQRMALETVALYDRALCGQS